MFGNSFWGRYFGDSYFSPGVTIAPPAPAPAPIPAPAPVPAPAPAPEPVNLISVGAGFVAGGGRFRGQSSRYFPKTEEKPRRQRREPQQRTKPIPLPAPKPETTRAVHSPIDIPIAVVVESAPSAATLPLVTAVGRQQILFAAAVRPDESWARFRSPALARAARNAAIVRAAMNDTDWADELIQHPMVTA